MVRSSTSSSETPTFFARALFWLAVIVAATLGASAWRTFWKVTLPNIRRGLLLGVTLTAARSLGEFGAVLVLGGSIARRTETATTYIYGALEERQTAGAYGMALLLGVVSMLLLIAIERFKTRSSDT